MGRSNGELDSGVCTGTATLSCYWRRQKMRRTSYSPLLMLFILLGTAVVSGQTPARPATHGQSKKAEDFDTAIKKLRDTWVQEFNAGHADKVAALYAEEAVLMRGNGSLHNRDSILAELQRSITAEAHSYIVNIQHTEQFGDLVLDTGMYNEKFSNHL